VEYSKNYATEHYEESDNIPQQVTNIILKKKRAKRRCTAGYDMTTGGLGVVQRMRKSASIKKNKVKSGI
jgi:hypothetical protein